MNSRSIKWPARIAVLTASFCAASACASSSNTPKQTEAGLSGFEQPEPGTIGAQVAVYELVAKDSQRFRIGLVADQGRLVSFGKILLEFLFLGTDDAPVDDREVSISTEGSYLLVAGQAPPVDTRGPRIIDPSEGFGVYGTDVTFDRPGHWAVVATASINGGDVVATASFEVLEQSSNPYPGDTAPLTDNRNLESPGVRPESIDSRATDGVLPDPELHSITVADAVARGKPLMVVVSTPTYCVSRFCGPITDTVQRLASRYGTEMSFIHAEVWNDYEKQALNREAAAWIYGDPDAGASEPWVFLVNEDGIVIDRWDNVSTEEELEEAVRGAISA